jgi:hypothetical protein
MVGNTSGVRVGSSVTRTGRVAVALAGAFVGETTGVAGTDRAVGAVTNATIPTQ